MRHVNKIFELTPNLCPLLSACQHLLVGLVAEMLILW
ncbi:hypothetical protein CDHC01_1374 [Corynebacterium diphtheriae HC01]|nr:hypothetical protein CD241_1375 [Corynebacterium diphtheriae 241]AEX74623.1 hypothetical protein CDHC01_1374 [Corynebacterium diphtheriae HC01]